MEDRFNTPHTGAFELELLGHNLHIAQDPNSKHLGTTVWDSSLVFVKFLERNCRKGEFGRAKLTGKRVIELGAGCGLAGLGMALLGCEVVVTDQVAVLPLLMRNSERNMARAKYTCAESLHPGPVGSVNVAELDWGNKLHMAAVEPPFDYIIGTDVVYKDHLLEPLLETITGLSGPKTKVLLCYEFRASDVHEKLDKLLQERFAVKKVPRSKMDTKYQHANIELFILSPLANMDVTWRLAEGTNSCDGLTASNGDSPSDSDDSEIERRDCTVQSEGVDGNSAWSLRRMGATAARLLTSVHVPAAE